MQIELNSGIAVEAEKIEELEAYRGFYVTLKDGTFVKATFNTAGMNMRYRLGYETNGKSVVQHLHDKLAAGEKLSEYEKIDFYEQVDLKFPLVQISGVCFDFRPLLVRIPFISFYILEKKMSKEERDIFRDSCFTAEDIRLDRILSVLE